MSRFLPLLVLIVGLAVLRVPSADAQAAATKLAFTTPPGAATGGTAFGIQPVVTVQTDAVATVAASTAPVTLAITSGTGTSGAVLSGTATVNAVNGVATFSGLSIDKAGSGYTLTATSGTLTSAISSSFTVAIGAAAKLAFVTQPSSSNNTAAVAFGIQPAVAVQDAGGNTVTTSTAPVNLAIASGTSGAVLSGATTVNAANGVVTFSGLSIDKAGQSYTLSASSPGLTSATSSAFAVALPPATISLTPNSGPPRTTSVTASGTNFEPNVLMDILYDNNSVGKVDSRSGSWTHTFTVPASASGSHTVRALQATATFTVNSTASLSTRSGPPGTRLNANGEGFGPSQGGIAVSFDGKQVASGSADFLGSFSIPFNIPPIGAGSYTVSVGNTSLTFAVTSSFSVSPESGPPGTTVNVTGSGFGPNTTVSIAFDGTLLRSVPADGQGSISTTFQAPAAPGGTRVVSASGPLVGGVQSTFTVTPLLSLDRPNASPGISVTATGVGFGASETGITISFDGNLVASGIAADAQGKWSSPFTVPTAAAGSRTIRASGSLTSAASVPAVILTLGASLKLERSSGPPGTTLRVSGSGFKARESVTVTVGDGPANPEASANEQGVWTANVTIPPGPGGLIVIQASGASTQQLEASFTLTPVVSLSQPTGSPGFPLTVRGDGFRANQSGISITFGAAIVAPALANSQGSWTTTFAIPPSPKGTYSVRVSGSSAELEAPFTVTPSVSLGGNRGNPGTSLTVTGSGFAAKETAITVTLGETPVASGISADAEGSWSAAFPVPSLPAGSYNLLAGGSLTSAGSVRKETFTIGAQLTVSPANGSPGMEVNITGRGFGANEPDIAITYDGSPLVTVLSADARGVFTTSFVVPPSASGSHSVKASGSAPGAVLGPETSFRVTPSIALSPSKGPLGSPMTVTGSGFGANEKGITITYDNTPVLSGVSADPQGSFATSFPLPASPAGPHPIQAFGSVTTSAARPGQVFTAIPSVALTNLTGPVGMNVEATGLGFGASAAMSLTYGDGAARATALANAAGSFRLEFSIPKSKHGDHLVRVLDDKGNEARVTFVVESTPPVAPNPLSPKNGARGGILGGFRPAPKWAPVNDPSGASYTLQIDTDPGFSNPLLEKQGLVSPSYALTKEEPLPRGKYYWRVKAVDGASNEGPWSSAFVVRSGILPLWLIPTLVVLAVLAAGGGAYALVYRPRRWRREAAALPALAREVRLEPALTTPRPAFQPALGPAPRLALPAASSRRGRRLSPEEQARLQLIVDFAISLPILQVSSSLGWLEELVEMTGSTNEDIHERVLQGQIDLRYQPGWMLHPTYEELQRLLQGHLFLQRLGEHIEGVNACAGDTLSLLRRIYGDVTPALSPEAPEGKQWRFVLSVAQYTLAWFRGTYLREPSVRDYTLTVVSKDGEDSLVSLYGAETTPFQGPIIEGLSEKDAIFRRDLHIQLRINYRSNDEARSLAAKMASMDILRDQLMRDLDELGQSARGR